VIPLQGHKPQRRTGKMSDLKTISGLDNLGRCVDLVDLDPLDIAGSSKNVQAFFPKGGTDSYPRGGYEIPNGVETRSPFKLRISGGETLMSNSYDFTRSFEKSMAVEGGFAGFEFSASQSVKNVQKQSEKRDEVFTYVFANSAIHIVQLELDGKQSEFLTLNANIKNKVEALPAHEDKAYREFIQKFGTHFMTQVALGGMAWSRVSSKKKEQASSTESEETFKTEAKAEIKNFTAGASKTESRSQTAAQDQKLGITRSELTFVGGTGDVTEVSSSWVGSLEDKSVPIYEDLKLSSLSSLLTEKYFKDDKDIAKKQALLEKATTLNNKERGGEEGLRICYGQAVRLEPASLRRSVHYDPTLTAYGYPIGLSIPPVDRPIPSGALDAKFTITSPEAKTGEAVFTGDPVRLELAGNKTLAIETIKGGQAIKPWGVVLKFNAQGGAGGADEQFSMRIPESMQRYDGEGLRAKRRPLVSGDIVMITQWDAKGYAHLAKLRGDIVKFAGRTEHDPLFMPIRNNQEECDLFVVRNV
jgi:hypothetical protein